MPQSESGSAFDEPSVSPVLDSFFSQHPPTFFDSLRAALRQSEIEALAESREFFRRLGHRGSRADQQALFYCGPVFGAHGYVDATIDGQLRFHQKQMGFCVMIGRGHYSERCLRGHDETVPRFRFTSEKGPVSEDFIDANYEMSPRLIRLEDIPPPNGMIHNIWLMMDPAGESVLLIYFVYPKALSGNGYVMYCSECRMIGQEDLTPPGSRIEAAPIEPIEPPAPITEFEIELKEQQG